MRLPLIENCWVDFKYRCPQRWDALEPTSKPGVRTCSECKREVFFCETDQDAVDHARKGDCIARRERSDVPTITVGWPELRAAPPEPTTLLGRVKKLFGDHS
jgi:hypothetical protein